MSANPLKGEVTFEIEGEAHTLVYTIDSLCALEERLDMGVEEIGEKMGKSPRIAFLRAVFHAGLREYHPKVTEKQAGEMFKVLGFERVGEMIGEAFGKAFGTAEAAEGDADPQPALAAE